MQIDIHTHAFPPAVASKVLTQLLDHYGIQGVGLGLVDDLLTRARTAGLDKVVVHSAATAAAQVIPANNFAISLQRDNPDVVAFGTLHPDYKDWETQLQRLKRHGIKGLKLHPEFQGFWLDDQRLHPIIEAAQHDFIFMVHIGDRPAPKDNPSCPYKLATLLDNFPQAQFIGAHMGGYHQWQHALTALAGRNVYMDTSSTLDFIDDSTLHALFNKHDHERILFGSDYPLYDPATEMSKLQKRMQFSEGKMEQLLTNACKLLGL